MEIPFSTPFILNVNSFVLLLATDAWDRKVCAPVELDLVDGRFIGGYTDINCGSVSLFLIYCSYYINNEPKSATPKNYARTLLYYFYVYDLCFINFISSYLLP